MGQFVSVISNVVMRQIFLLAQLYIHEPGFSLKQKYLKMIMISVSKIGCFKKTFAKQSVTLT
jgi:hypothetical protein